MVATNESIPTSVVWYGWARLNEIDKVSALAAVPINRRTANAITVIVSLFLLFIDSSQVRFSQVFY
jgi:hypothetical protein